MNDKLREALEAGWKMAAQWANREDLIADIGSPAFELDAEANLKALAASKPEPQAQAGEPEIVAVVEENALGNGIPEIRNFLSFVSIGDQLITLQSHREAMENYVKLWAQRSADLNAANLKKDAALQACVEALHSIDQQIDLSKYPAAPPDVTLLDELRAAITQAKEARK